MLMKRYRPTSYVVRKGTLLYTGTGSRANRKAVRAGEGKTELLYLSPNKEVAEAYRFVVTAEVTSRVHDTLRTAQLVVTNSRSQKIRYDLDCTFEYGS